jgi:hypothetical protein
LYRDAFGVHGEGVAAGVFGLGTVGVTGSSKDYGGGLSASDGVQGKSPASGHSGVWGDNSGDGYGVAGSSTSGYGGFFHGGKAPLLLGPSNTSGAHHG